MATAKIVINDEANCKILGLDLNTRKKLVGKFKYEIPGARFTPACKLGRWDGCKTFAQLGGSTYINLLTEILPMLDSAGYDVTLEDLREYNTTFEFDAVHEKSYAHKAWPKGHEHEGEPIMLRDYQVEAINTFLENTQSIQCLATGSGKTIMTAVLSHKCEPYGRTIVVVPSKDLVLQTERDYINMGLDVGVFFGTRKEYTKTHTICTWQSLNSLFKNTKNGEAQIPFGEFIEDVVCVMIDECLAPGTLVKTPSGNVAIETLVPGDKVYSFNELSNEFIIDEVVKLHVNLPKTNSAEMYEFELDDGSLIQITGNHKMLTDRGWVAARDINEGDNIRSH
jgi:hypothetical protein